MIYIVGGTGDGSSASDNNGGGYNESSPASLTWLNTQGSNGSPLDNVVGATVTNNGSSQLRITSVGNFSNSLVGILVNLVFAGTYTDGRYEIITATDNYIDVNITYSADTTADAVVGGALADPNTGAGLIGDADELRISQGPYTTPNVNNYLLEMTHVVTATDNYTETTNQVRVIGVDGVDGEPDFNNPIVFDGQDTNLGVRVLTNYLFVNLHSTNPGSGPCFDSTGGQDRLYYLRCKADRGSIGISGDDNCSAVGCEVWNNSNHGIEFDNDSRIIYCLAYDNLNVGLDSDGNSFVMGNKSYDNGTGQIQINYGYLLNNITYNDIYDSQFLLYWDEQGAFQTIISGNVLDGKNRTGSLGISCSNVTQPGINPIITNNTIINCAVGINSTNNFNNKIVMSNNNFFGNNVDMNIGGTLSQNFDPIIGDPAFSGSGSYKIGPGSALEDRGLDWGLISGDPDLICAGYYNQITASSGGGGLLQANKRGNKQ